MVCQSSKSELLIFDLEAYVPREERKRSSLSLAVNPYRAGHMLLGGVFHLYHPATGEVLTTPEYEHHWVWQDGDEAETVSRIYQIFAGMHERTAGKKKFAADPVVCGIGIANFDMPFICAKCMEYEVAPKDEIYESVCKFRVVDLNTAAIGFVPGRELYPVPHNRIADYFLPERNEKPTGKVVWDMADNKEYALIEKRCETEVREMKDIADAILTHLSGNSLQTP
ncbi:MAG TPA: hypothetical protein O0X97_03910 [Methanocorpusculum sp.]|nr:hypothetical protein [Methanocorpusculum sp.]